MPIASLPAIALPPHEVGIDDLVSHVADAYHNHPRLDDALRAMRATTVDTRRFTRPLEELSDPGLPPSARSMQHFEDACALAEEAARRATQITGVDLADIDGLICVSTAGYTIPGIDLHLVNSLPLAPTVRRVPVTQMGCAGGAYGLARAVEQIPSLPSGNVLVVCSDVLVPFIHPRDTDMDAMIFRGLMGDGAAACVVHRDTTGPGLGIEATWDYTIPDTFDIVGAHVGHNGMHIHNSPRLYDALTSAMPPLAAWFAKVSPLGATSPPQFVVSHPGGPRIMEVLATELRLDPSLLSPSWDSLREHGNLGSASVLDALIRTYAANPPPGSWGLVLGVGPGISITACLALWHG